MQDLFIEFLPPWVETGLQPAFYDRESGTVLQQTARMYAKVNELVKAVNGMDKIIKEYVDYINHYFENLDVQEEINNKLDDMLESGELETAIAQFLAVAPVFAYSTVADMVASEYLATGCIARTLGKELVDDGLGSYYVIGDTGDIELDNGKFATKVGNNLNTTLSFNTLAELISSENIEAGYTAITLGKEALNDGYGAIYTIGETGDVALDNGLYATLKNNTTGNNYYDEITIRRGRQYETDYYLATIPLNDNEGNMISPYVVDETDTHTRTPLQYGEQELTTLTLNAGLGRQNSQSIWVQGAVIANGVITRHDENDIPAPSEYSYIGFKPDRSLVNFSGTTEPETMLEAGVIDAFMTFGQVITDGVLTINEARQGDWTAPLVFLGTKADGTMLILATDGRTIHDKGISATQGASMMLSFGCTNAWNLDGGGSTSMVYKGSKQNRNIDDNATKDRGIWVTLNFKKQTIDKQLGKVNSFIGEERQLLNKQIRDDVTANCCPIMPTISFSNWNTGYNNITDSNEPIVIKAQQSYTWTNNLPSYEDGLFERTVTDDKYDGFIMHQTGLFKVSITATISTANTSGWRTIELVKDDGTLAANWAKVGNVIPVSAGGENHTLNTTFLVSNSTIDTKFKLYGYGQVGDDFNRINVVIEFMGATNS